MESDPADKLADVSDTVNPQMALPPHRLSYHRQSPSREKSQRRHTVGRISFDDHSSTAKKSALRLRPKSLECIPEKKDTRDRRPSFYLARTSATTDEFVVLDAPGSVTDEATLFPLQDNPSEQAITIRSCFTGILMGIIGAAVGLLFIFKPVMVYLAPVFLQIMCMFFGRILALIPGPKWWNPGAFSLKETVYSSLISMAARNVAYAIAMLATEDLYFDQKSSTLRSMGVLLSTQMIGYGWAFLSAPILVYPSATIFPHVLSSAALFYSVSGKGDYPKKQISLFHKVFAGITLYEIIPTYLMPALQGISFPCLVFPGSTLITSLFGGVAPFEGLGFFELSFDWNIVGAGSPLATPLFAQALQLLSVIITALVFWPAYSFSWFGFGQKEEFPFLSVSLFQENGTLYPINLFARNHTSFIQDQIKLPIYTSTNVITQIFQSLAVSSSITHILLWQWPMIRSALKGASASDKNKDPHRLLVQASYIDLPLWVSLTCLGSATGWALALCYKDNAIAPYSLLIAIGLSGILTLSMGFICAISGYTLPLNGVCQMIGGLIFPKNVMGNMWFSNSATTSCALSAMSEMKLGQYTHMPPTAVAAAQATGLFVGVIVDHFVLKGLLSSQREALLLPNGNGIYSGTIIQNYGASAIAWGRFSTELYTWGGRYVSVPLALAFGLFLPVPFYLLFKIWPHRFIRDLNIPLIMGFVTLGSLGVSSGRTMNILVGLASQLCARRYYPKWFYKYNYVLSAALDGGTQIIILILSLTLQGGVGPLLKLEIPTYFFNPPNSVPRDYCFLKNSKATY
ncbi:hypothetical protein PtA15_3A842 [Puccinia triticina]|uniref:OPT family small oligopeptide transporter n=1 Tax=Puccinia triticina TaxID=208348 RepID=A0ABY7CH40_9BASI|nr:uncharacterized protein PtA15_3A842 [Puccinia triticina]WAQ83471.1 hypothetical protein PtA15_3A842 [Puccinia triticina]